MTTKEGPKPCLPQGCIDASEDLLLDIEREPPDENEVVFVVGEDGEIRPIADRYHDGSRDHHGLAPHSS